jgi:hypothetical protein
MIEAFDSIGFSKKPTAGQLFCHCFADEQRASAFAWRSKP